MYKLILSILSIALSLTAHAQSLQDSTIYKGYLYNSEYEVYLNIDFYNNKPFTPIMDVAKVTG